MEELQMGIDDAGRGPVIGPMVVAGCLINEKTAKELRRLGVKDSKELTQKRRLFLREKIIDLAEAFEVILISPEEIDSSNEKGINLNQVEAIAMAKVTDKINNQKSKINLVVDCPSINIETWKDYFKRKIDNLSNLNVSCEHKADQNHISVSAASVLAKCAREDEMEKLKEIYGKELGSGYPSDPVTCKFLTKYAKSYVDKGIFRKTWKTWKVACEDLEQQTL